MTNLKIKNKHQREKVKDFSSELTGHDTENVKFELKFLRLCRAGLSSHATIHRNKDALAISLQFFLSLSAFLSSFSFTPPSLSSSFPFFFNMFPHSFKIHSLWSSAHDPSINALWNPTDPVLIIHLVPHYTNNNSKFLLTSALKTLWII